MGHNTHSLGFYKNSQPPTRLIQGSIVSQYSHESLLPVNPIGNMANLWWMYSVSQYTPMVLSSNILQHKFIHKIADDAAKKSKTYCINLQSNAMSEVLYCLSVATTIERSARKRKYVCTLNLKSNPFLLIKC
jgi:hypothetical protein